MRYLTALFFSFFLALPSLAQWEKISEEDYVWGPFKIYTLSLFSENGDYIIGQRPLMLSLTYAKPVEGRDFAISLARSWSNLDIRFTDQDKIIERLKKTMPSIRQNDVLSYIALSDRGYFILNDTIVFEEINQDFSDAVVAIWLDPRVEIGQKLLKNVSSQAHTKPISHEENEGKSEPNLSSVKPSASSEMENPHPFDEKYHHPERSVFPPFDPINKINKDV